MEHITILQFCYRKRKIKSIPRQLITQEGQPVQESAHFFKQNINGEHAPVRRLH